MKLPVRFVPAWNLWAALCKTLGNAMENSDAVGDKLSVSL